MPTHALAPLPIPGGAPSAFWWKRAWRSVLRRFGGLGVEVFSVRLDSGQELRLHEVAGWIVACRSGTLWITQEADARDIFLKTGEGFALDRGGLALVRACHDALLSIRAPVRRRGARRGNRNDRHDDGAGRAREDQAQLNWLGSLCPECGPWNDPASYRRAGLL